MALVKPTFQSGEGQGYSNPVNKTAAPAPGMTQAQMDEIKRKAQNGIALVNPTAEKTALYNSYKTNGANPAQSSLFDQNAYSQQMMDQSKGYLDNIFNQQKEAQLAQLRGQRDKAIGQINQQKAELAPQYQGMRNQADVVNMQNVQRLREVMANAGLTSSGENVSANVAANNQRLNSINSLNLQEQQARNDFDRRITDLNNPAEENAMIAALEAQRSQSLYDAFNRAQDGGYQRYRDSVGDARYADETQYNRGRDAIGDQRYNAETAYNHGRDKVADSQWSQQFNYGKQRDQVGDKQWQQQFNYQAGRDKVGDSQWQQQFNYGKQRDSIGDSQWQQNFNQNASESSRNYKRGVFESDRNYDRGVFESDRDYENKQSSQTAPKVTDKESSNNYIAGKTEVQKAIDGGKYTYNEVLSYIQSLGDSLNDKDYKALLNYADKAYNE